MESEIRLIQQAGRGDKAAFETLFEAHFQAVYNYALNLSGDPALAEDLTQETFIRAHRSLSRFGPPWKFRPWLFQITRNLLQDHARRQHDLPELDEAVALMRDPQPGPEQTLLSSERSARIRNALRRLPPHHREALILRELEGLSYDEIAMTMGVSSQYIKVLIHRARAKFQENYAVRLLAEEPLPDCPVLNERLDALHDGETLSGEEERFIRDHLRSCRVCQQRQRELVAFSVMLGAVLPVSPPPGLEGRALDRVRSSQHWSHFTSRAVVAGGLAISALILILFGWFVWRGLTVPASPVPTSLALTASPSATYTPPSTSNAMFFTPTLTSGVPFAPPAIATEPLSPPSISQPNIPPVPPTETFTPPPPPDTDGPGIKNVSASPDSIFASQPKGCKANTSKISALVNDPSGVQSAVVIFVGTSAGFAPMSQVSGKWQAVLGPFDSPGAVNYQIRAFDNLGNRSNTEFLTLTVLACVP